MKIQFFQFFAFSAGLSTGDRIEDLQGDGLAPIMIVASLKCVIVRTACVLKGGEWVMDATKTKRQPLKEVSTLRGELPERKRHESARKRTKESALHADPLLISTLESTPDGILVVDNHGKVVVYNGKFISIWRIPESLTARQDDDMLLNSMLGQLKEPGSFIEQLRRLRAHPEADSFDILEFKDGCAVERYSQPQRLGNEIVGRVWSFRDVTDRRRAEEEQLRNSKISERLAKETAMIAEIGRLIGSTLEIDEVYDHFAAETRKLILFDRLSVHLFDIDKNLLSIAYVSGSAISGRNQGDFHPLTGTFSEEVIRMRMGSLLQPASIEEIDRIVARFPLLSVTFQAGLLSVMGVPLIYRNEVIGVLHFRSKKPNAYGKRDLLLAERIGAQIAGAIANAQLFSSLKKTERSLRESEGRFRALVEQAAVGVAEIDMGTGRYMTVNRRLCEMVGRTEEEMLATTFPAITHPEDARLHEGKTALLLAGKIGHYSLEKRYLRKDGDVIWVNITVSPLWRPGEKPGRNMIIVEDITERKQVQQENERRSRQLAALHQTGIDLTAELNLNTLLQSIAERALGLIGGQACNCYIYDPESDLVERVAVAGRELVLGGVTRRRGEGAVGKVWETGKAQIINDYHAWPERKPEYDSFPNRALMTMPVCWGDEFLGVLNMLAYTPHRYTEADKDMLGMFAPQAAIAIRNARLYSKIEQISVTDELTGLFNRRGFSQLGEREIERASRFERPLAVLMLDIDHFKKVNDTYGHPIGDQVLRALAACIRQGIRRIDVVGRYGGEEFTLLLPETDLPVAIQIAERLRQSVAELAIPIPQGKDGSTPISIRITVSVGVAFLLPDVPNLSVLIHRADQALYRVKDSGRNRVVVWEE